MDHFDIAVVGAGLAGALAALALDDGARRIALIAPPATIPDGRTTALMDQAIALLKTTGLWEEVAPIASPLATLRIVDGTQRLLRAPAVAFRAAEIGLDAFGYNIPNATFLDILTRHIADRPRIVRIEAALSSVELASSQAVLHIDNGTSASASLVVGADGRGSTVRTSAGIETRRWTYPQTALVLTFAHERPHEAISTEFHTEDGPFTQVPLPGRRSSLVWVMKPDAATTMLGADRTVLSEAIERRMQSMLGRVEVDAGPQAFPLSGMTAGRCGAGRSVLIGEAAHAFPPIGAQGLNLSLRDISVLNDLVASLGTIPADIGERFDRRRRADIVSRTAGVDLLNRSLLTGFLPVQMLRAGGLQALASVPLLRNLMMREGLDPGSAIATIRQALRKKIGRHVA